MSELPSVREVRKRIEQISYKPYRMACKAAYLLAARASEIVGRAYAYERCYGIRGSDVYLDVYKQGDEKFDAVVFRVKTAKRNGLIRNVALPVDYEPWSLELYDYFSEFDGDYVFPFTRQELWRATQPYFHDLTYLIEEYYYVDEETGELKKKPAHLKRFGLHGLRHLRTTELVEFYGFDGFNLSAYCGWTIRSAQARFGAKIPKVIARYLYLNWQAYFPKLLKKRL